MSQHCECSTDNTVVMLDEGGAHRWSGDSLQIDAITMVAGAAYSPEMLVNRREGCGKPKAPPPTTGGVLRDLRERVEGMRRDGWLGKERPPPTANPAGGMLEYRRDGAFWRRYPDGTETGPHAESIAPAWCHREMPVFVAHGATMAKAPVDVDPKALTCDACGARPRPASFDPALCVSGGWRCDCGAVVRRPLDHDDEAAPAAPGDFLRALGERVEEMKRDGWVSAPPQSSDGGAKARAVVADVAKSIDADEPRPSIYGPCSKGCGAVAERDGYTTILGVYCPCGGVFAGLRFDFDASAAAPSPAEDDPEARQRAVLRAELDRKVEPKGGRR